MQSVILTTENKFCREDNNLSNTRMKHAFLGTAQLAVKTGRMALTN